MNHYRERGRWRLDTLITLKVNNTYGMEINFINFNYMYIFSSVMSNGADDKYKNCVILSLLTIIVLKLISNSYRGMGEVIDTDIMYVHQACFFVNISFAVNVIFPIVYKLENISYKFYLSLRILTII
jgi:accessory gene regulator protein AgrB